MGRALRNYESDAFYFVTARTFQSRLLLRPNAQLNEVVGGVLARAARRTGVELYGYVAMSNHLHLLCRARDGALSRFMQQVASNVARKAARLAGWTGHFWHRRFAAEPVFGAAALEGRLKYILAHGVKEGLVRKVSEWPGLTCAAHLMGEPKRGFRFFEWARRWKSGRLVTGGDQPWSSAWAAGEELELLPLPHWRHLSLADRREKVLGLIREIEAEHLAKYDRVSGIEAVLRADPHSLPEKTKRGRAPWCHASDPATYRAYVEAYRSFATAFSRASKAFRNGDWAASFPPLAFRPWVPLRV